MKTYHGERTERGCEVTVDGAPLHMCSNLSGNATTAFDWGYVGTGQLSLALLSDLLGNDTTAKSMSEAFEREVVANMPHDRWTMTDRDLATALAPLVSLNGARVSDAEEDDTSGAAFGDMPVESHEALVPETLKAEDAAANSSMVSEGGNSIRLRDTRGDEAMSTLNKAAADHSACSANHAADEATALVRKSADEAKRVLAKPVPTPVVRTLDTGENPQHLPVEGHESPLLMPDLNGFKVMVVGDEADGLGPVKRILQDCGATVLPCTSGAECLTSLPKLRPDVVIVDTEMSGIDGSTLIGRLRALSTDQGGRTPAVALTSFAGSEDRRQAMPAGFDAHVAKPFEPGGLMAIVSKLARHSQERAVSWPPQQGDAHGQ